MSHRLTHFYTLDMLTNEWVFVGYLCAFRQVSCQNPINSSTNNWFIHRWVNWNWKHEVRTGKLFNSMVQETPPPTNFFQRPARESVGFHAVVLVHTIGQSHGFDVWSANRIYTYQVPSWENNAWLGTLDSSDFDKSKIAIAIWLHIVTNACK